MDLTHAKVVVTGAARGLGRVIAEAFGNAGARVALVDILEDVHTTSKEMASAGMLVLPVVADTTNRDDVDGMVVKVLDAFGCVDVLVNNAGTFSVVGPVWEADPEKWFRDVEVNLYGSFLVSRAVVKGMVERGSGYVINIVSGGGVGDPHPFSTSYASSKTGLMRLTEGLAAEAKSRGVKVFAVGPPAIRTQMTEFLMDDEGAKTWRPTFGNIFEEGRDAPPELVSDFIMQLMSGKADALTGRFFDPRRNFDDYVRGAERIVAEDLWTLRITGRR